MRELAKSVADLIRGTAIVNNEFELAKLRQLPPEDQIEFGIVLRAAMFQEKDHT